MFDVDPNEHADISGADFAIMCDEIKELKRQRDELMSMLKQIINKDLLAGAMLNSARKIVANVEASQK